MPEISILAGCDRSGKPERFGQIHLKSGGLYTIVGHTGSGKSRLIKDIEQLTDGDSVSKRHILLDGRPVERALRRDTTGRLVAHLGQNMRFVLDTSVKAFIQTHAACRGRETDVDEVLALVNTITPEAVAPAYPLHLLSGGQARALMIADIALICDSPIVLIDEIENAGVDKERAFSLLQKRDKLVLVVTHDPHTALMARQRIIMRGGGIQSVVERTRNEETLYQRLSLEYHQRQAYQALLREGERIV